MLVGKPFMQVRVWLCEGTDVHVGGFALFVYSHAQYTRKGSDGCLAGMPALKAGLD